VSNRIATLGRTAQSFPKDFLQSSVRPGTGDGTSMFVALWEFEVKPGCEERFEKVYGPGGDWARLFRKDTNYQETRLVRDAFVRSVYLTMDFWQSRCAYEQFMEGHRKEYAEIEAVGEALTVKERRVGWFEIVEGRSECRD